MSESCEAGYGCDNCGCCLHCYGPCDHEEEDGSYCRYDCPCCCPKHGVLGAPVDVGIRSEDR